jgi:IS30 family transposase
VKPELSRKLLFKTWYKKRWGIKKPKICPDLPRVAMRSNEANERQTIGDREVDSVVSVGHRWWATTLTERFSRYMLIKRSIRLDATTTLYNMIEMLSWQPVSSITSDNGSEFAFLDICIKRLHCLWYLCDPYCSWQKWSNEKNNREFRVHIPKWSDFSNYSDEDLQRIQDKINRKPRKILGYKSAYEVYHNTEITYLK